MSSPEEEEGKNSVPDLNGQQKTSKRSSLSRGSRLNPQTARSLKRAVSQPSSLEEQGTVAVTVEDYELCGYSSRERTDPVVQFPCGFPKFPRSIAVDGIRCILDGDTHPLDQQYCLICSLKPDQKLSQLMASLSERLSGNKAALLAMILINCNYTHAVQSGFFDVESDVSLYIVGSADGKRLIKCCSKGNVYVSVVKNSKMSAVKTDPQQGRDSLPTLSQPLTTGVKLVTGKRSEPSVSGLFSWLKEVLENREEGFSSKQKMFTTVLEGFRNFEKNRNDGKDDAQSLDLKTLVTRGTSVCELFLHLAIVHRITLVSGYPKDVAYKDYCTKVYNRFIQSCTTDVTAAVMDLLEGGNFEVPGWDQPLVSVFRLLSSACDLMAKQTRWWIEGQSGCVMAEMFWIVLSTKFKLGIVDGISDVNRSLWTEFISSSRVVSIGPNDAAELDRMQGALALSKELCLPPKVSFSGENLAELLITHWRVNSFVRLTYVVSKFKNEFFSEVNNILEFLESSYALFFSSNGMDTTSLMLPCTECVGFVSEVAVCLDGIGTVDEKKEEAIVISLGRWWRSVVDLSVVADSKQTAKDFKVLMAQLHIDEEMGKLQEQGTMAQGGQPKELKRSSLRKHLRKVFTSAIVDNLNKLTVPQFVEYANCIRKLEGEVYLKFFEECQLSLNENLIGDRALEELLWNVCEVWKNWPSDVHVKVVRFLMAAKVTYHDQSEFVYDLLHLKNKKLLLFEHVLGHDKAELLELRGELQNEIETLALNHRLCDYKVPLWIIELFVNGKLKEITPFVKQVMNALVNRLEVDKEDMLLSESQVGVCVREVVQKMNTRYLSRQDVLTTAPRPPNSWYWKILVMACQQFRPSPHSFDLEWCRDASFTLSVLTETYRVCKHSSLLRTPPLVRECTQSDEDLLNNVRDYFEWFEEIQRFVQQWCDKVKSGDLTRREVEQYVLFSEELTKIAEQVQVDSKRLCDSKSLSEKVAELSRKVEDLLVRQTSNQQRCSLMGILHEYNVEVPESLQQLLENGIIDYHRCLLSQASVVGVPGGLRFKRSQRLADLRSLVREIDDFLSPLVKMDLIPFLVHFAAWKSSLFSISVHSSLSKTNRCVYDLSTALTTCRSFLSSIVHAEEDYSRLYHFNQLSIEELKRPLNFHCELQAICNYLHSTGCEVDERLVKNAQVKLELASIVGLTGDLFKIFDLFQIIPSPKDEGYTILMERYKTLTSMNKMDILGIDDCQTFFQELLVFFVQPDTSDSASQSPKLRRTMQMCTPASAHLTTSDKKSVHQLDTGSSLALQMNKCASFFMVLSDSAEFHKFLVERKYKGEGDYAFFSEEVSLIMSHLQHEEHDEEILEHLQVAYRFISPFLNITQNVVDLLKGVRIVLNDVYNSEYDFCQLRTVNNNIDLIRLWFLRMESDSLQKIADDLNQLLSCGQFELVVGSDSVPVGSQDLSSREHSKIRTIKLNYATRHKSMSGTLPPSPAKAAWDLEKIEDFTRRLGFLEKGQENQDHKHFQQIFSVVQRMFVVQCKLRDLGYLKPMAQAIRCSELEEAQSLLQHYEQKLVNWRDEVRQLQRTFDKLLFFSLPKIMRIYKYLMIGSSQPPIIEKIFKEVSFLFPLYGISDASGRLQHLTKVTSWRDLPEHLKEMPLAYVGSMLDALFQGAELNIDTEKSVDSIPSSTYVMHLAENFSSKDLIRLIVEIYDGIPGPYEVYHCRPDSTEEELTLFFQRARRFLSLKFTILQVDLLSSKLQDVFLRLHIGLVRDCPNVNMNYIATKPCVLQGMPHLKESKAKPDELKRGWEETCVFCEKLLNPGRLKFAEFCILSGPPGSGKSHFIKTAKLEFTQLAAINTNDKLVLTIAVNESFAATSYIQTLRRMKLKQFASVYFNFTILPPNDQSTSIDKDMYNSVMTKVWWFLFDLFFLGYVEDPETGISFTMPQGLQWSFYFEVPSEDEADVSKAFVSQGVEDEPRSRKVADKVSGDFYNRLPILHVLGRERRHDKDYPLAWGEDMMLILVYLFVYGKEADPNVGINMLLKKADVRKKRTIGFQLFKEKLHWNENSPELEHTLERTWLQLLHRYLPKKAMGTKILEKLFIGYMKRRCLFLEGFDRFTHNTGRTEDGMDTSKLGSTVMKVMLDEVASLCEPQRVIHWLGKNSSRRQFIYGSNTLYLMSTSTVEGDLKERLTLLDVKHPPKGKANAIGYLHQVLAAGLHIDQQSAFVTKQIGGEEVRVLKVIEEKEYVLTRDYTMKMLEIHERFECGVPVIIEGETGVGKTALVEMLSILWNDTLQPEWDNLQQGWSKLRHNICDIVSNLRTDYAGSTATIDKVIRQILLQKTVLLEDLEHIFLSCKSREQAFGRCEPRVRVYDTLSEYVTVLIKTPCVNFLDFTSLEKESEKVGNDRFPTQSYKQLVEEFSRHCKVSTKDKATTETELHFINKRIAHIIFYILRAKAVRTFHKLNVHAALTIQDYMDFFEPVISQAMNTLKQHRLKQVSDRVEMTSSCGRIPRITVFLDEINTSSCIGLLKEIIVDGTFLGKVLPENLFIIAACNPHRGNSIIVNEQRLLNRKPILRTTYSVHRLHPTITKYLKWDYGALNEQQEEEYVKKKIEMMLDTFQEMGFHADHYQHLQLAIVHSQKLLRRFSARYLKINFGYSEENAEKLVYCCVSQRDIQRVFTFFMWLMRGYQSFRELRFPEDADDVSIQQQAVLVSVGLVYYLRLDHEGRKEYKEAMDKYMWGRKDIDKALREELDFYAKHLSIPRGIAKTRALMENLFSIIACCCTRTPLIIVGEPGSSKTLSFNLALYNLKGAESKMKLFRNSDIFPSLDPHFYQCSRRTTSTEVETVFQRAIKRQAGFNDLLPINCVVFMDEAGLPEESHESLKVLHKYLDSKEVAFVAISNHPLDAAKTNRAVSLLRSSYTEEDMEKLAEESSCMTSVAFVKVVKNLSHAYLKCMKDTRFAEFFGLRDFIHMIHYLRRKGQGTVQPDLIMRALERNFNGFSGDMTKYYKEFMLHVNSETLRERSIVDILRESLTDHPNRSSQRDQDVYDEVRYKLIIDPSDDDSVSRLITEYVIPEPEKIKTFMCSDFPEDNHLQKVNTIAAIRHAAEEGKTVLMSQTDDIHESFYDLFNQHFRRIDNPDPTKEPKFYANIAIGSHHKPCRVHKDFQCVVIIKESEVKDTPAPFLNRFEKYRVSHKDFLRARLDSFPPCMRIAVNAALEKVKDFFDHVGEDSFYGARRDDTVGSIALSILPKSVFRFKHSKVARQRSSHNFRGRLGVPPDSPKPQTARTSSTVLLSFLIDELTKSAGFVIPEYSEAELKSDAAYIVRLLGKARSSLQGVARAIQENKYSDSDLRDFVKETLQHLHNPSGPDLFKTPYGYAQIRGISSESCFVVMVFVQWLVQYMCKHLLQLMTAEALTQYNKKTLHSLWCWKTYLEHQNHFSLKSLIEKNLKIIRTHPKAGTVSTKLVCFTRFTPDINHLPSVHLSKVPPSTSSTDKKTMTDAMKNMICEEIHVVHLYKLTIISSEHMFRNYLKSFMESTAKVFVMVINMQETKKQMVNHIRIMVEQAEGSPRNPCKLFVLLLHFPPSMFYDCCYPALFLNGWDHHYFDSLTTHLSSDTPKFTDIRHWFTMCRSISAEDSSEGIAACEAFIRNNLSINPVDISVVASRITIGSKNGGEFNSTPRNGNEILTRFQKLLESPVGDVLCDMYAKYWKPSEMARYLEEAASYARNRKSTLSMTDSIGDFFQTTFQNFLTYMINMMNEGLNLDNVYKVVAGGEGGSDMERIKKDLFLQMMLCLPTPDLNQLKDYSYNWSVQSTTVTRTFFPFFVSISSIVDRLLDESKKRIQEKKHRESLTTVLELKVHDIDPMSMSEELLELLKNPKLLPTSDNSLLCCAVQAIKEHPELWDVYWRDFHVTRFHINIQEDAQLAGYPQEKPACTDSAIACLAKLHCSAAAAGLSGCKHLLLDLNPLTVLKQNILKSALPPKLPNPVSCLNEATQSGSPSELARFIIDFLFRSLAFGCLKWGSTLDTDDLFLFWSWRNAYRDVTSQSRVTEILFKSPEVTELNRVEMTVMAAVYLLLQTRKTLDEEISKLAFDFGSRMVFKFFSPKEPLQLRVPVLHVEDVMDRYQAAYQYDRPHRYTEEDDVTFRENLLTYFFAVEVDKRDEKDIVWFLNHVNALPSSHNDSHKSGSVSDGSTNPFHRLSQEVIGHMLGMILTPHTSSEDLAVPLEIFHHQTRKLVGAELMRTAVPGEVGPYIPPVYRNMLRISATADPRMTQLLADLYFNSTLEQLERVTPKETSFVAVIGDLQNVLKHIQNSFLIPELQILLRIELQAMMQMLLKKVAQGLADKQQQQNVIDSAIGIEDYIEGTIMDCNSDGREAAGHKLVLMKHLYKDLQGPGNLIVFLTQFDQSDGGLHFFESYKSQLNLHYLEVAIQFPFATGPKGRPRGYVEIELDKVYFELYMCIMEANKKGDFESSSHLLEWLKHCVQTQPTLTCGPGNPEINTKCFLRMSIWLIVYELYNIIKSPNLIETLCERIDFLDFTEQHQMVLRTFLKRSEMERNKRSETPLQEEMERILGRERRQEFSETDPLFDLFMKPSSEENDSTEESFRNALANLLAVVFSLPSESTHLWYLFHDPTKLRDTFLPGFMYPHKVNKDKMLYDCGILLNEDGEFGRPDYRDHDSGLSLHSFYLVTWSTIGTLCMSLLTNPQAQEAIHGHLISDWQPLRHFCLQQLRQIWLSMQTNLELNNEERDFFFVEAMLALFKKGQSVNKPPGMFHSQEDVFQYERMWHKDIYQSTMCGYRDQMLKRLTFLRDYIYCQFHELDSQYPQFPSEKQLKHNLVSVQDCSEEPKHTVLLKFLEDRHRLAVGSALLPDLVEFYLWLDVHLAHLIRYEVAQTLSVGELIERVEARPRSTGKKLQTLYGRLMTNFNKYIHLSGGSVEVDGCTVQTISQDTELVHFLSVDKGRNSGYLYAVIRSIVKIHNDVMSVPPAPDPKNAPHYHRWMPSEVERVDVREFSSQLDGVFSGNNNWLLSLIQSRYIPVESLTRPEVSLTSIQHTRSQPMFDLSKLESDIVRYFIAGKRTIEVGTLWKPFRFKSSKVGRTSVPASLTGPGVPVDLAALSQELPSCCKVELYCDERKQWETHFHNVSYGTLSDLVTCLKSSCGYMYKSFQRVGEEILEKDLMEYLRSYFDDEESSHASKEIFSKLGLDVKCLKPEQLETLEKVKMRNLFRTLEMFVGWIGDCLFDFHMLPFSVKTPLPSEVAQTIQREIANHDVTLPVIEELEEKVSSLSQQSVLESQFKPTDSLRQCLIDLKLYGEKDGPFYLVPLGVQIQHYMYFVVFLRRLKLDVKGKQVANDQMKPSVKNNWSDFVHDIWTRLPHFLDKWRAYSIYSDTAEADAILHPEQILSDVDTTSDTGSLVDREGDSLSADILEQHQSIPEEKKEEVPPEVGGPKEAPQVEVTAVTIAPAKGEVGEDNVTSEVKDSQHVPSQNGKDTESSPVSSPPQPPKQGISDVFGKPPSEKALNMTVEEVVQWLDTIKLGQLAEAFRSEEVDGALLATYDLKDLEDIGIELNKDRKKILVKFRQI